MLGLVKRSSTNVPSVRSNSLALPAVFVRRWFLKRRKTIQVAKSLIKAYDSQYPPILDAGFRTFDVHDCDSLRDSVLAHFNRVSLDEHWQPHTFHPDLHYINQCSVAMKCIEIIDWFKGKFSRSDAVCVYPGSRWSGRITDDMAYHFLNALYQRS